jgi:hypothetical protein
VNRAALYQHVAGFEADEGAVKLHVDLAFYDDGVIDRISPMVSRRNSGREFDDAKYRAVLQGRADFSESFICVAAVINRKGLRSPDDACRRSRPIR